MSKKCVTACQAVARIVAICSKRVVRARTIRQIATIVNADARAVERKKPVVIVEGHRSCGRRIRVRSRAFEFPLRTARNRGTLLYCLRRRYHVCSYLDGTNRTMRTSPLYGLIRISSRIAANALSVGNPPVPDPMTGKAIEQ